MTRGIVSKGIRTGLGLLLLPFATTVYGQQAPDFPAINNEQKIQVIDLVEEFTSPYLPSHRTTNDGRIAIPLTGGAHVYLNVPEKLTQPVERGPAGTEILARNSNNAINRLTFYNGQIVGGQSSLPTGSVTGMRTVCEATSEFDGNGAGNPYSCGTASAPADCYEFHVVTSVKVPLPNSNDVRVEMWSREMKVEVADPKTAAAQLTSYEWISVPKKGLTTVLNDSWHLTASIMAEPVFTGDGKFLISRLGGSELMWDNNGTPAVDDYNIVYSVIANGDPCDVTALGGFKPITHAQSDLDVKGTYGFADYPFRDPEGTAIPDGMDLRATYPWVDRAGANIMFETLDTALYNVNQQGQVVTRYPTRCAGTNASCNLNPTPAQVGQNGTVEWKGTKRGVAMLGRWTNGKMVLLDGLVNNSDYGLGYEPSKQREIQLYAPGTGPSGNEEGWVNAGVSQHSQIPRPKLPADHGIDVNLNFIDSLENIFMYRDAFQPISFRDVVWLVNSGRTVAEVAFDDYIDHRAYIVSNMTPSLSHTNQYRMQYRDGYNQSTGAFDQEIRLQNSATTGPATFPIPAYGVLQGGGRTEPIAMGGIEGKGLFLEPSTRIDYSVPATVSADQWVVSMFIDPRFGSDVQTDTTVRRLLTFPDGTEVNLVGSTELRVRKGADGFSADIPGTGLRDKEWNQIGLLVEESGRRVSIFFDGYRARVWNGGPTGPELFEMNGSTLSVGSSTGNAPGVRGWIDDFKIFAHGGNPEYMCNLAKGTLIGLPSGSDVDWLDVSNRYSAQHHSNVTSLLPTDAENFDNYACFHDYSGAKAAYRANLPAGAVAVGHHLSFPEGPIASGSPRPNSSANAFCLNCHSANSEPGLGTNALLAGDPGTYLEHDLRRQPSQPLRRVFGYIPANFLGAGAPGAPIDPGPSSGDAFLLDPHLFPGDTSSEPPATGTGIIGDTAWIDADGDGIHEPGANGEIGLGGVAVSLLDCDSGDAEVATTQSDAMGQYAFTNVPAGNFRLQFAQPAGYDFTDDFASGATGDVNSDVNPDTGLTNCYSMAVGQHRGWVDAGFVPQGSGFMGDFVWEDTDGDGWNEPGNGEQGLGGVNVFLQDCDAGYAELATTVSDVDGNYAFTTVPIGNFRLRFVPPTGYDLTVAQAPNVPGDVNSDANSNTGLTTCYGMSDGQHRGWIDAGFEPQ